MYNDLQLQSFGSHYNIEQMLAAKRIIHVSQQELQEYDL